MSRYEFTFLLPEEAEAKNIKELVKSLNGKIEEEEKWGKKDLVYSIKKNISAYYFHLLFSMEQKNINELKKKLNFNEKLIRYLLLKVTR
ncbi:30S ribosomal protein S6 [Candidatus Roizmanbacteria bacterium RIFCSPLOWO2_01_FULL_37_13]|uniref:Small ribosomal subunit protein bS6 n=1 Tax=Candidatus Roizmanbacteria bacterium RIFCSPHIGHO2_02_FULL_38_11 TaxID=1802039 RepID=A0A1F7H0M2_9BACT|nr:MAG: 30S ribosomal protein S6 [Candidatus Roizmanbacteria bacterium RIFCSPHIGHO2_02_FULL_38_11]OGK32885.1 MAG: 30S ribosomal protein S6 [Candidatus Roizmanbacteria bacterium RIFCSPHIGHO2_12_FULL_37_9b]OGK42518.1 MAG: 30S ribosomal protein S6 [Candidatus Roizmanbacteria bacterium RIFCSPLOWO2_01_FULL_37_13]